MWNMEERRMIFLFETDNSTFDSSKKRITGNTIECQNCGETISNKYSVSEHKKCSHIEAKLNYDKCGMVPEDKIRLDKHIKTHHQDTNCWPKSDFVIFGFEQ